MKITEIILRAALALIILRVKGDKMKKEQKTRKKTKILPVVGSLVFFTGAILLMPKIIDLVSDIIYQKSSLPTGPSEDNWGPEIVKKKKELGD